MSDQINRRSTQSRLSPPKSTSASKNDNKRQTIQHTEDGAQQPKQSPTDTFSSSQKNPQTLKPPQGGPTKEKSMIDTPQTPIKSTGRKRAHSPKEEDIHKNTRHVQANKNDGIQARLRKEVNNFLLMNPDKKIESWGHYPLIKIIESGECPYSANRPLMWGDSNKHKHHHKAHQKETGFSDLEQYTNYALSVLLSSISASCPAFFSLEIVPKNKDRDKGENPSLLTKIYRFDKEKELIVVGDASGRILTCFPPKYQAENQSKDEWFRKNFLQQKERIDSNIKEIKKRSSRQSHP